VKFFFSHPNIIPFFYVFVNAFLKKDGICLKKKNKASAIATDALFDC